MSPHTPDQVVMLGLTAVAVMTIAAEVGLSGRGRRGARDAGAAPVTAVAVSASDTVPPGDRRCLTRRPEDCLDRPVPVDEPHQAICSVCHRLWERRTLSQTARSCSGGGCHARPEAAAPFHRTVSSGALAQCTACHLPHGFRVEGGGTACSACHEAGGASVAWRGAARTRRSSSMLAFRHPDHASVACARCHGEDTRHGTVLVRDRSECRACHHAEPLASDCTQCHRIDEVRATSFTVTRTLEIRVGALDRPVRTILFDHAKHWRTVCTVCHTGGPDLETARGADCSGCHLEHHEPTAPCRTCHEAPARGAHDRNAHFGCGGPDCHDPVPDAIRSAPRTRELCLVCHRGLVDHEPGRDCVDCHALPPPR